MGEIAIDKTKGVEVKGWSIEVKCEEIAHFSAGEHAIGGLDHGLLDEPLGFNLLNKDIPCA